MCLKKALFLCSTILSVAWLFLLPGWVRATLLSPQLVICSCGSSVVACWGLGHRPTALRSSHWQSGSAPKCFKFLFTATLAVDLEQSPGSALPFSFSLVKSQRHPPPPTKTHRNRWTAKHILPRQSLDRTAELRVDLWEWCGESKHGVRTELAMSKPQKGKNPFRMNESHLPLSPASWRLSVWQEMRASVTAPTCLDPLPFFSQHEHGSFGFVFSPCCLPSVPQARKRPSAVFFGLRLRPLIKFFYLIANLCSHNINPQPPTLSVRLYYLCKSRTTVERSKKKMRCWTPS